MEHHFFNDNNHRTSTITMPINNQISNDSYEYELMKIKERERQLMTAQQRLQRDNIVGKPQQTQYVPSVNEIYTNIQQSQVIPQVNRRVLPSKPVVIPVQLSAVKPLRIIIIRHAERADAILGSDWSKKSFDRNGRYIRFSEHLPDALPIRSYLHHYVIDVPLTNRGRLHAFKTGKALLLNGYAADICYTSPSLRCVQSADGILNGMSRKGVPMQLEPGLFECYLNDFKRTLCFMTKDELASNGYNIDKSYQALMPFMRPHDSQLDYYERCRTIMDIITERHQATGGTILIVAHAPSLEGLTRHLSGGKFQPEKLFDIARRVPFLAMTILEKNITDNIWLFRTQPLQTSQTQSMREISLRLASIPTPTPMTSHNHSMTQHGQQQVLQHHHQQQPQQRHHHQQQQHHHQQQQQQQQQYHHQQQQRPQVQATAVYTQQNQPQIFQHIENIRLPSPAATIPIDPKKVKKSSTAPNLRTSTSLSEMFRVI